ncbi:MAG: hypothetical protein Ta2B_00720 [Termitinemataceae bacterium]|nr:MAG: hypothetical protein Ta2B_00720 [Termitinemataceae bacterium]
MKNFLMLSLFFLTASFLFAQIEGNVELYGGAVLIDETSRMNGPETVYKSASVSAGISGGVYFNNTIGLKAYLDFLIPLTFTADPDGGIATTRNDYDFLLGMDEFFGVVFNVVKTDRLQIPIMTGFHSKLFFSTISNCFTTAISSGIALGIGVEYAFNNKWYIMARVNGAFDFMGFSIMTPPEGSTKFDMAFIDTWEFAPHIGIGFRF